MKIVSVNVGKAKTIKWKNKTVTTGIFKHSVKTLIVLGFENVDDDSVVDRKHHGGINKAVYAYGFNHYNHWQKLYPKLKFEPGMFGENLTIDFLDETQIHIGDVFKLGSAKIEVAGPREPCYKLGIRFNDAKIVKQFWQDNKCGVYFKLLTAGKVTIGDLLIKQTAKKGALSVAEVYNSKKT